MTSWSARLARMRHVLTLVMGLGIALLDCATYDGLSVGGSAESGSGGDHGAEASARDCNPYGGDACAEPPSVPDVSIRDASRGEPDVALDGATADQADERGPADVPVEIIDQEVSADAPDTNDADDVQEDVSDSDHVETGTADALDADGSASDARDAEAGVADAGPRDASDVTDAIQPPTFYRAINVGGSEAAALVIDGQSWEAGLTAPNVTYSAGTDAAGSGGLARVTTVPLIPPTDANRTSMIQTFAWGRPVSLTMSNVPSGRYLVYMYTWEDNGAQTFDVLLQGQVVLSNYNSGADGHWERLGPWPIDVGAGTISLGTSPTTGPAFANLCGIEVWRQ